MWFAFGLRLTIAVGVFFGIEFMFVLCCSVSHQCLVLTVLLVSHDLLSRLPFLPFSPYFIFLDFLSSR